MKKAILSVLFIGVCIQLGAQPREISVKEFLKLSPSDTSRYVVKGVVSKVRNTSRGTFYLQDNTGTLYVYGLQDAADAVAVSGRWTSCKETP